MKFEMELHKQQLDRYFGSCIISLSEDSFEDQDVSRTNAIMITPICTDNEINYELSVREFADMDYSVVLYKKVFTNIENLIVACENIKRANMEGKELCNVNLNDKSWLIADLDHVSSITEEIYKNSILRSAPYKRVK